MSNRRTIPARYPGISVVVGWDNPMQTFFAQVDRIHDDDDPRHPTLLWIGTEQREVAQPEQLIEPLAPFAAMTPVLLAQLRADRAADVGREPTPLQRMMLGRLQSR